MLLKGQVTDSAGGVPAIVFKSDSTGKNLGVGTAADIDGNYSLDNINVGDYITASLVGQKPQTKVVTSSPLNFNLSASTVNLSAFEVIDYYPKPPIKPPIVATLPKPTPVSTLPIKKQNWFKRNETAVIIASVSIVAMILGIFIIKSTNK